MMIKQKYNFRFTHMEFVNELKKNKFANNTVY